MRKENWVQMTHPELGDAVITVAPQAVANHVRAGWALKDKSADSATGQDEADAKSTTKRGDKTAKES